MKNRLDISDSTAVSMPMKNLLAIIAAVCVGVWAYFGVLERLTSLETKAQLAEKDLTQANEQHKNALATVEERLTADLEKNTEFRIKWPRGEMGSLPADSEQFLLIEDMIVDIEKLTTRVDDMMNNKVNIERLIKDVDKLAEQMEVLKDKVRRNGSYKND